MADLVRLSSKGKDIDSQLGNDKLVGGMKTAFNKPEDKVEANEQTDSKPLYGLDDSVKATAKKMASGMKKAFGYGDDDSSDKKDSDSSVTSKVLRYLSFNKDK